MRLPCIQLRRLDEARSVKGDGWNCQHEYMSWKLGLGRGANGWDVACTGSVDTRGGIVRNAHMGGLVLAERRVCL